MPATATPVPTTMLAISQDDFGDPSVLQITERPVPQPGPSQVLIQVHATSLNPTDLMHRAHQGMLGSLPRTLGWDVAGTVVACGPGVTIHTVGDTVFGMLPYPHGHGAAAEYVIAPARAVVPVPVAFPIEQAGALPLVGLTAWQALVDTAGLHPGQRVLIHAAAGGVGHVAVQIAKARGAHVIATASTTKQELVESFGADEVIDYTQTDFANHINGIDVVIDPVGGDYARRSLPAVLAGGTIVSLALRNTTPLAETAAAAGVRHALMLVEADRHSMAELAALVESGRLSPKIAGTFDLHDIDAVRSAHREGESGRATGKLVLHW